MIRQRIQSISRLCGEWDTKLKDDVRAFKKKILWKTAFFPGVLTIIWAVSLFIISDGVLKAERQKEIVCIVGTILFFLTAYSFSLKKIIKYFLENKFQETLSK